jgi:YVTN family beta-propeller protein
MVRLLGARGVARETPPLTRALCATAVMGMLAAPLAAVGIAAAPAAAASAGYGVKASIPVGSIPYGVGADRSTHTAYVANSSGNSVSVIDEAANTVTATIAVGSNPLGVAVDPSTHTVYVTNSGDNSVSVIDEATNTATATIAVGSDPIGVGVDPTTHTVYVANYYSRTVSVIDEAANTVTATIAGGNSPDAVGVDPSTHTVYVTNDGSPTASIGTVSVIDGASDTVTATINVNQIPVGVGVDPSTHTVYVANRYSHDVSVIDGATDTVTATIAFMGAGPYLGPSGVGVDLSAHTAYVTDSANNTVSVIAPPQPGPVDVTATTANTATVVSWNAPPYFLNGATVTGYTATASPGSEACSTTGATSCKITGLTNDTTYSITVVAHTTAGDFAADAATVVPWGPTCPCTLWPSTARPAVASAGETSAVNLGVQFTPAADGWISGIRFYKGPGNIGAHTGLLWTADGALLGHVLFTNESASGWQEADFPSPIAVTVGTTYVASYLAPNGGYSYTNVGFAGAGVTNGPLTAPQSSAITPGNGVYAYSNGVVFPNNTFRATNYWVDVVFTMAPGAFAPTVTDSTPGSGSVGNSVKAAPTATFSQAVAPATVSFTVQDSGSNTVAGTVSFNTDNTVATFTPANPLAGNTTYTATVSGAQNSSGTAMANPYSWNFTTAGSQCPCTLWPSTAQPAVASANDTSAANLGVQFTPAADGWISGIRFYKGLGNTGTHTGELWTAGGTLLGKVTFTGESASGWQEADFPSPVAVTAGTTYVASYLAPNGGYSYTTGAFGQAGVMNGPLTAAQSSAVSGGNGVYNYSGSPSFPTASYNANNYWVDVVFTET